MPQMQIAVVNGVPRVHSFTEGVRFPRRTETFLEWARRDPYPALAYCLEHELWELGDEICDLIERKEEKSRSRVRPH